MATVHGEAGWLDLTVPNAEAVRDFYKSVVGWTVTDVAMGSYNDYAMNASDGRTVAGVCHKQASNANIPSVWLVYFTVQNLDNSIVECTRLGGKVLAEPRAAGNDRFAIVQDPAGAVCALYEKAAA